MGVGGMVSGQCGGCRGRGTGWVQRSTQSLARPRSPNPPPALSGTRARLRGAGNSSRSGAVRPAASWRGAACTAGRGTIAARRRALASAPLSSSRRGDSMVVLPMSARSTAHHTCRRAQHMRACSQARGQRRACMRHAASAALRQGGKAEAVPPARLSVVGALGLERGAGGCIHGAARHAFKRIGVGGRHTIPAGCGWEGAAGGREGVGKHRRVLSRSQTQPPLHTCVLPRSAHSAPGLAGPQVLVVDRIPGRKTGGAGGQGAGCGAGWPAP